MRCGVRKCFGMGIEMHRRRRHKKKRKLAVSLLLAVFLLFGFAENIVESANDLMGFFANQTKIHSARARQNGHGTVFSEDEAEEQNTADGDAVFTVTFLDVGQGNAVLVENDGLYMLIDGGGRDYSSYVVSYLQNQGVQELEYVVSSHYDADHLNGIVGALHVFSCGTLLAADYTADTRVYQSFLSVVEEKGITMQYPDMGATYTFGDAEFTIVCPDAYDYEDVNDNSIGIRLVYGENSFLICGDAGTEMEEVMMQSGLVIDSDVYMASHHGSAGSSSLEFLKAVSPEAVVISAGLGNSYGHPTSRVLEDIREIGAELYRTDLQGEIIVTSDGTRLEWNVAASEDFRSGEELSD